MKMKITMTKTLRDVIEDMATKGVSNEHEFQWKAQLRYYYENTCVNVNMINATVPYSNEYLGNTPRWFCVFGYLKDAYVRVFVC